jgi:hypothetical protein
LWAEPTAPDPAEHNGNKQETQYENQGSQQDQIEFLDSQNLTEQVEAKSLKVYSQQAFTVDLQPWKEQECQGGRPLKQSSLRAYETAFIYHEKTGQEGSRPALYRSVL